MTQRVSGQEKWWPASREGRRRDTQGSIDAGEDVGHHHGHDERFRRFSGGYEGKSCGSGYRRVRKGLKHATVDVSGYACMSTLNDPG